MCAMSEQRPLNSMAVIGTYAPRRCGIATFTADLCHAIQRVFQPGRLLALALDDVPEGYPYPDEVCFQIRANQQSDYRLAANFLNINQIDVAVVQHEFGIFGGPAGSYLLQFMRDLRMPVLTNLHTILTEPDDDQRAVMNEITKLSSRLLVMSRRAVGMLQEGQIKQGLTCIQDIRDRYDGRRRSPFNEAECGHHYGRAMASWAAVTTLTGFEYSGVTKRMAFVATDTASTFFWSNGYAWGTLKQKPSKSGTRVELTVLHGSVVLKSFELTGKGNVEFNRPRKLTAGRSFTCKL